MTIIRITQHQQGIEDYLEHGIKKGRTEHREELDVRVPLLGNLSVFQAANAFVKERNKHWKDRYWHITISIPWQYHLIPTGVFREMTQNVLDFYFHLYQRQQLAAYAEIHYPKKQTVLNPVTLKHDQRLPHVHLIVSKLDLWSNNQLRILPYKKAVAQAFQIWLDAIHQFEQPDYRISSSDQTNKLPTPKETAAIIRDYQAWHRKYNQPDLDKQTYKPSFFLNQPVWQNERNIDKKRQAKLRERVSNISSDIGIQQEHDEHRDLLNQDFSTLSALRQRLTDETRVLEQKSAITTLNQHINMTEVLHQAAQQFGLDRSAFQIIRRKDQGQWIELAQDKRTDETFSAMGIAHELLHLPVDEAFSWLQSLCPELDIDITCMLEPVVLHSQENLEWVTKSFV
jgi:hypothetical protein